MRSDKVMIEYAESSMLILFGFLAIGCILLYYGGEFLCKGAESLALKMDINPVIIGLTIVSVATSMPELITSYYGAKAGSPGIAVGNIVGSNLANIGLVLGVAALIAPIHVQVRLLKKEVPILLFVTILFFGMSWGGIIEAWEGAILLAILAIYTYVILKQSKREDDLVEEAIALDVESQRRGMFLCWSLIAGGALLLHFGADCLVNASVEVATRMGVDEVLIGLTIVAVGTSLPELAASVSAARRGQSDICVGNVVGSNIFNMLLIGGGVSTIIPLEVDPSLMLLEYPAMLLLTLVMWRVFITDHKVTWKEGVLLLLLYFGGVTLSALKQFGIILS